MKPLFGYAGNPGIGHQQVHVTAPRYGKALGLVEFISEVGWTQRRMRLRSVFGLDDEFADKCLATVLIPGSGEGTVPSAVVAVEVADDGLAENLAIGDRFVSSGLEQMYGFDLTFSPPGRGRLPSSGLDASPRITLVRDVGRPPAPRRPCDFREVVSSSRSGTFLRAVR